MSDSEVLNLLCISNMMTFAATIIICWGAYYLTLTPRRDDTRRFPRYGKANDMRDNRGRVKSAKKDKET